MVAAYRDRYRITDDTPLGAPPVSEAQKINAVRARAAIMRTQGHANYSTDGVQYRTPTASLDSAPVRPSLNTRAEALWTW